MKNTFLTAMVLAFLGGTSVDAKIGFEKKIKWTNFYDVFDKLPLNNLQSHYSQYKEKTWQDFWDRFMDKKLLNAIIVTELGKLDLYTTKTIDPNDVVSEINYKNVMHDYVINSGEPGQGVQLTEQQKEKFIELKKLFKSYKGKKWRDILENNEFSDISNKDTLLTSMSKFPLAYHYYTPSTLRPLPSCTMSCNAEDVRYVR